MPVNVSPGSQSPNYDIRLSDDQLEIGLLLADRAQIDESPISSPMRPWSEGQDNWISGFGRVNMSDDKTGFFDSNQLWTMRDNKIFPMPKWYFSTNVQTADDALNTAGTRAWKKLIGSERYISNSFTASASYNAGKAYLWIRRRGTPRGNLTVELCQNNAGDPGTVSKTVTITTTNVTDTLMQLYEFDWTTTQALTSGTVYHVKVYGDSNDENDNCWEVLVRTNGSGAKRSSAGSVWTGETYTLLYRVATETSFSYRNRDIRWYPFMHYGVLYAVNNATLYINGDRGTATAGASTSLTDSGKSWATDVWANAWVKIVAGTGEGQNRQIVSNTGTVLTVAAWETNPDTTSVYIIYSTPRWQTVTVGGTAITKAFGRPVSASQVIYVPQGPGVNMLKITMSGSTYTGAANGTVKSNMLAIRTNQTAGLQVISSAKNASTYSVASANGGTLTFGTAKAVGSADTRINGLYVHNGVLYVFKEDDVFSCQSDIAVSIGANFADVPDDTNGIAAVTKDNNLYWTWGKSVTETSGINSRDMLNWKTGFSGLPANMRGDIVAMTVGVGWLFAAIDGGTTNYSSVIAWNGYGWHIIWKGWRTGFRVQNIAWQANEGTNPKLWIFGDEIVYIDFPAYTSNPLLDTSLSFMEEGALITPTIDASDKTSAKLLHELRVISDDLSTTGTVRIDYQVNEYVGTTTWTRVPGRFSQSPLSQIPIDRGDIYKFRLRFVLETNLITDPPILEAWDAQGWMVEPLKYQYSGTFKIGTFVNNKTGAPDNKPDAVLNWLIDNAKKMKRIRMRSLNSTMDDKVVVVSAPRIIRTDVNPQGYTAMITLFIREA